jgi:hypothetical protein
MKKNKHIDKGIATLNFGFLKVKESKVLKFQNGMGLTLFKEYMQP